MRVSLVLVALLILLVFPTVTHATGWSSFQNDDGNTGVQTDAPRENPAVKWSYETQGDVVSSPVVSDGKVYVATFSGSYDGTVYLLRNLGMAYAAAPNQTGNVYGFDRETGDVDWRVWVNGSVWSTPAVVNDTVYVGTLAGRVYGIDSSTGNVEWNFDADEPVLSVASSGEHVYVGTRSYNAHGNYTNSEYPFYALNRTDGSVSWQTGVEEGVSSTAGVSHDRVYVGGGNGSLRTLNRSTGETVWGFETAGSSVIDDPLAESGGIASAPTVVGDTVYFASYPGNVYAVNRTDGEKRWNYSVTGEPTSTVIATSPAVYDGTVYIGSYDNSLYALDADTGRQRWSFPAEDKIKDSSPVVANGTVYVGSNDGHLYAVDASNGTYLWSYYTGGAVHSSPAVSGGSLYFTSLNGVHAVEEDRSGEPLPQQGSDDGGEETARAHAEKDRGVQMGVLYPLLLSFGIVSVMAVGHFYYRRRERGDDR